MAMKARIRSPLPYGAKVDYKTEVFCTDSYPYPLDLEANTDWPSFCRYYLLPVQQKLFLFTENIHSGHIFLSMSIAIIKPRILKGLPLHYTKLWTHASLKQWIERDFFFLT